MIEIKGLWEIIKAMRYRAGLLLCLIVAISLSSFAQSGAQRNLQIARINIEGNSRFAHEGIIAASGLRLGQTAVVADFERASGHLLATGMFQSVSYRYEPSRNPQSSGVDLTFQIADMGSLQPVKLDIPEVDEIQLWQWLKQQDPLLQELSPGTDQAFERYATAIERFLKEHSREQEVVHKLEADLKTKELTVYFRPKVLPVVKEIRFEGIHEADSDMLLRPLARTALGSEYTEYSFRRLLELNVRPVYEELGYLAVAFPKVEIAKTDGSDGVAVTVFVEEGAVYRLDKVNLDAGDFETADLLKAAEFPVGKAADWKEISGGIQAIEDVFRSYGYISVSSQAHRNLDAAAGTLILDIRFDSGKQYFFGQLILAGLDAASEAAARRLWKLDRGVPMDELYLKDYSHAIFDERAVATRKAVTHELKVRPGTDLVDVILTFR